jgi:tRNA pseudouridine55 synthase
VSARADEGPHGGLVIDKPTGPTSHDVVGRVRRLLGTRRVGHAGTLDPMASGVLVVLVGEATKLSSYLTLHDKRYRARVEFGVATTTLDADGETIETAAVPAWLMAELDSIREEAAEMPPSIVRALAAERARQRQLPPAHSAIKIAGRRSYDLARRGAEVILEERDVSVIALDVIGAGVGPQPHLDLDLKVSKGYYVRSLARDIGTALGVPAHLSALRRLESGPFSLEAAVRIGEGVGSAGLARALLDVADLAQRALPVSRLTAVGVTAARAGKRLTAADFEAPPPSGRSAWLDPTGRLVAIGIDRDGYAVERGFN